MSKKISHTKNPDRVEYGMPMTDCGNFITDDQETTYAVDPSAVVSREAARKRLKKDSNATICKRCRRSL